MVQGPLLLRKARGQREQGRQVGRRYIKTLRELGAGREFVEFRYRLGLVEHERLVDARDCFDELIARAKELIFMGCVAANRGLRI